MQNQVLTKNIFTGIIRLEDKEKQSMLTKNLISLPIILCLSIVVFFGCASTPEEQLSQEAQLTPDSIDWFPKNSLVHQEGDPVQSFFQGKYIGSGKENNVPKAFGDNVLVFTYEHEYAFNGEVKTASYEVLYANVLANRTLQAATENTLAVSRGFSIGSPINNDVSITVRSTELDLYLVAAAERIPEYYDGYWYFAGEIFNPAVMKFFAFEEIESMTSPMVFPLAEDHPSLESLTEYPGFTTVHGSLRAVIQSELSEYPYAVTSNTPFASTFSNCPTVLSTNIDGVETMLYFQEGFDNYLLNEYTLGNPIYLYLQVYYANMGTLYCYVRDFSLDSPNDIVIDKISKIETNDSNGKTDIENALQKLR